MSAREGARNVLVPFQSSWAGQSSKSHYFSQLRAARLGLQYFFMWTVEQQQLALIKKLGPFFCVLQSLSLNERLASNQIPWPNTHALLVTCSMKCPQHGKRHKFCQRYAVGYASHLLKCSKLINQSCLFDLAYLKFQIKMFVFNLLLRDVYNYHLSFEQPIFLIPYNSQKLTMH